MLKEMLNLIIKNANLKKYLNYIIRGSDNNE